LNGIDSFEYKTGISLKYQIASTCIIVKQILNFALFFVYQFGSSWPKNESVWSRYRANSFGWCGMYRHRTLNSRLSKSRLGASQLRSSGRCWGHMSVLYVRLIVGCPSGSVVKNNLVL